MSAGISMNRTGMLLDPELASEMEEVRELTKPSSDDPSLLAAMRSDAIAEAEPIGSLPDVEDVERGQSLVLLLDMLGDRLAFERSGTRLYETLQLKVQTQGTFPGGPTVEDVNHIREEELQHFLLVKQVIERLEGDPTQITPSADLGGVIGSGVAQAINDPRTNVADSLKALLVAELTDNDSWEMLIKMTEQCGYQDLVGDFTQALSKEREHLQKVRGWIEGYSTAALSNANFADDELSDSTLGDSD